MALWQTHWVQNRLQKRFPDGEFEILSVKTQGDKILDVALSKIGDKGLFTKELDVALLEGRIDLAVHSLKDVPTQIPDGLIIAAVTERWDARDALISRNGLRLADMPPGAMLATGSLRRRSQLLNYRPDFKIVEIRGNLNTRFRRFDESDWHGMILAAAGVERLEMQARITEKIDPAMMLPAVGQGSFALMCRVDDSSVLEQVSVLNHAPSQLATTAERALLRRLEGGCQIPIGAYGRVDGDSLQLTACIGSLDGTSLIKQTIAGPAAIAEALGIALAEQLLEMGGREILADIVSINRKV